MALSKIESQALDVGQIGGRRNIIINGAMQVAQRGTSDTTFGSGYSVDRMFLDQFGQSGDFHTYQQLSSDPPVGFINYLRWQRNSSRTDTGAMRIYYTGETGASEGIAGNKLTLSFYARAGADYSGGSLESRIVTGEGTDQSRSNWANGNWTNQVNDSQSNTLTTSWQRFTHTLASAAGDDVSQHALRFVWTPTGTASTNDYIEITGVQLEVGDTATPFEHRSYGEELLACSRYFQRYEGETQEWIYNENNGTNGKWWQVVFPNGEMRNNPSLTFSSGWTGGSVTGLSGTITSMSCSASPNRASCRVTMSATGGSNYNLHHTDSFNGDYCYMDAEL